MPATIRVGAVNYLNAKPLIERLTDFAPQVDLSLDLPSRLADRLAAGSIDVGLIPVIEYFRGVNYSFVPNIAIASRGPVLSVTLFSRVPLSEVRSVALDEGSRTSAALAQILLRKRYGIRPAVEALPIDAPHGGDRAPDAVYAALADELGDLLYQVVFHAVLAQEVDAFTMADVARGVHDKLVRRHPHVFGDVVADEVPDVLRNWEQIKLAEKGTTSLVDGITPGLPSLLYTNKLFRKAASVGLEPGSLGEALDRVDVAVARMRASDAELEADLAQLLAAAVVIARAGGVDAESALRGWAARYRARFAAMESLAIERGVDLAASGPGAVAALWLEARV